MFTCIKKRTIYNCTDNFDQIDCITSLPGADFNAQLALMYCGLQNMRSNILIPGAHAWVRFKTDASVSYRGFRLAYDFIGTFVYHVVQFFLKSCCPSCIMPVNISCFCFIFKFLTYLANVCGPFQGQWAICTFVSFKCLAAIHLLFLTVFPT